MCNCFLMLSLIVVVVVVVTHWSPFGCTHCQLTTGLVSNLLLHLWHRVLLLWEQGVRVIAVIARLRTHMPPINARHHDAHCNVPHITYHTVQYHVSHPICRIQNCYNTTGHILCAPYHLHTSPRNILYFRLHHNTTSTTSCTNGLRSYEMRYDTSNQSTTPG